MNSGIHPQLCMCGLDPKQYAKDFGKKNKQKTDRPSDQETDLQDFPGGSVVKTPFFQCWGLNLIPGQGTSWEIDGETVSDFILGGSKITADGDCSHEIKRYLLLERKVMTNLDSIFKSRDITLPTKVCLVKAMVFPVVMYGCESWTVKKADC